ncbi:hypothetical protein [Rhizobium leguminosarum]|uniref:Tetratricopeptide repeat protein n=1 Tax=Rhizobium leguminosarum TaxID=384 RepID=A0A2Z4YT19_RHILE|nr:hypothetical protein [Rhizobium leguminosarum]AXA44627.1 hypothetical protein DLJ82_6656 [Rhizobium leguminosarum]
MVNTNIPSPGGKLSAPERLIAIESKLELLTAAKPDKPWYKQPGILISLSAFIISLATTGYSTYRAIRQDVEATRVQLQVLVSQLNSAGLQQVELNEKYKNNAQLLSVVNSALSAQSAVVARKASAVATKLGDEAAPLDLEIIARSLQNTNDIGQVESLLLKALRLSTTSPEYIFIARDLGALYAYIGKPENGEEYFNLALKGREKFADEVYTEIYKSSTDAWTHSLWAQALEQVDCKRAGGHIAAAVALRLKLPTATSSQLDPYVNQVIAYCGLPAILMSSPNQ